MQIKLIMLLIKVFFITKKNKLLFFMTFLITTTIIIATAVCALTFAIQNSIHNLLQKQLRSSFQDAIITPKEDFFCKKHVAYLNASPIIAHWAPASWRYVLVTSKHQANMQVVIIKFVDPQKEKSFLLQNAIHSTILASNHLSQGVIVGSALQKNLGIAVGDSIDIMFLQEQRKRRKNILKPTHCSLKVTGVICTGTPEFDETLILCSYRFGKTFMSDLYWEEIAIRMKQNTIDFHDPTITLMQKKFPELVIRSLKELYPTFFASILLEQYATWVYLILLLLFVFIALIALFFMQTMHNQKKVIILHFLGMNIKKIYI